MTFPFTPNETTKIIYLDATGFKESGCMQKMHNIIVTGLRDIEEQSWFAFGSAIHKYIAHLRTTKKDCEALSIALQQYAPLSINLKDNDFRTLINLSLACTQYNQKVFMQDSFQTMNGVDGKPLIEQKFSFPANEIFPELLPIMLQYNIIIILCGTVDEIGIMDGDTIVIKDIKTSSMRPVYIEQNIQKYFSSYELSIQMMFYAMITEHLLGLKHIGAFIDGIFFIRGQDNKVDIRFARSVVFDYGDKQRFMFKRQLNKTIVELLESLHTGVIQQNYALCDCSRFASQDVGQCKFFKLCSANDDHLRELYLKRDFKTVPWEPLKFGEYTN